MRLDQPRIQRRLMIPTVLLGMVLAGCSGDDKPTPPPQPPPNGPKFHLEIVPEDGVFIEDSVHCVVAEGPFSVPWQVLRDSTAGDAEVVVKTVGGAAVAGNDFDGLEFTVHFADGKRSCDRAPWPYFFEPGGVTIRDDDRPEPDEQFVITLVEPSPGYRVDPARGSVTVTIIDDDQPQAPLPVFLFPLEEGDVWAYREVHYGWNRQGTILWSEARDGGRQVDGARIFKGEEYARRSGGEDACFFRQEGTDVFLVPGDVEQDPPAEGDTLAFGRWQHLPWHLFDASATVPLAVEGIADTVCVREVPPWGCTDERSLSEGVADHGWSAIAVPAGIFRRVRRVSFHSRTEKPGGNFQYVDGAEFTWYIADSVGIVCELAYHEYAHGGGVYGSYNDRRFLTAFTAPGHPVLRHPRQP